MRAANLGLRFLLELCALAALVYWGVEVGSTVLGKVLLAIGSAAAFVAVWGRWVAPRASARLADPQRLVLELALFAVAVAALAVAGQLLLATLFAVVLAISELLGYAWGQRLMA